MSTHARPLRRKCPVPLGGREARGSKPACAGLDGPSAWNVPVQAAYSARGSQ